MTTSRSEFDRLLELAGRVLGDFPEYQGFDGFDTQQMLDRAGLIEPRVIDQMLLDECEPDYCQCRDYYTEDELIGETCYRVSELGERARKAWEGCKHG